MLRDYQIMAFNAIWDNLDKHVLASLPTASGKSHIIAELCKQALQVAPGTRVLVIAHVKELLEQNSAKIRLHWPDAPLALYCAGLKCKEVGPITVASIQSIYDKGDQIGVFDLIIVDEAHRIPHGENGMYHTLFRTQPQAKIVGLTATPYRLGGGLLYEGDDALFEELVCEIKTADLVEQGYLARIRARPGSRQADLSGVHIRAGEYMADEMAAAFDDGGLTAAVVDDVLLHATARRSIMVFCCSVAHCHSVLHAFAARGEATARVITGGTPSQVRADVIADFKARKCRILINCDVLTTGFDAPNIDCIVLLRATQSPGLYVQMIGRGLRQCEGKTDCLLLDYGGNVERHGPIDSVTAERVQEQEREQVKTCPVCGYYIPVHVKICPDCGYHYPPPEPTPRKITHGLQATTLDPLSISYTRYWVSNVYYMRHQKPGRPDSLKVIYDAVPETGMQSGLMSRCFYEWVCFEHSGYPRTKAREWSYRHGVSPAPKTVTEALACPFAVPKQITVRMGGQYPEVVDHEF